MVSTAGLNGWPQRALRIPYQKLFTVSIPYQMVNSIRIPYQAVYLVRILYQRLHWVNIPLLNGLNGRSQQLVSTAALRIPQLSIW